MPEMEDECVGSGKRNGRNDRVKQWERRTIKRKQESARKRKRICENKRTREKLEHEVKGKTGKVVTKRKRNPGEQSKRWRMRWSVERELTKRRKKREKVRGQKEKKTV